MVLTKGMRKTRKAKARTSKGKTLKVTKTVKAKKLSDPMRAGVLAVVRRMINRKAENKMIGNLVEDEVLHNSAIGSADCEPLVPEIPPLDSATGSTARQRIGDRITPKSLVVNGVLSLNDVNPSSTRADIYARVIIASQKDVKTGASVLGGNISTNVLLRPGFGGTSNEVPFTGNIAELCYDVNKDKYRVYMDRTFKFSQTKEGAVEQDSKYSYAYSYVFSQLPASLTFDEENGNWPNNFAPFIAVGYAYSDGTAPDTVSTRLTHTCYTALQFEDL